ncbi:MAG: GxxExxY protein [Parachlamydiales bacterium]|nr:GxxExxY protein [Parachlamydiales bacterium]
MSWRMNRLDEIILELKAVEKVLPVHEAQLLSYLRLSNKQVGLLINFNVPVLKKLLENAEFKRTETPRR